MNKRQLPPNCAALIKERLTMQDVMRRYGARIDRNNRTRCFLHGGQHHNMVVFDSWAYCFVCHGSADVIDAARTLTGLSFPGALAKLNDDFRLGLPVGKRLTLTQARRIAAERREMAAERVLSEAAGMADRAEYNAVLAVYRAVQTVARQAEPYSDAWCDAKNTGLLLEDWLDKHISEKRD